MVYLSLFWFIVLFPSRFAYIAMIYNAVLGHPPYDQATFVACVRFSLSPEDDEVMMLADGDDVAKQLALKNWLP